MKDFNIENSSEISYVFKSNQTKIMASDNNLLNNSAAFTLISKK
jgi:hypothetical protein